MKVVEKIYRLLLGKKNVVRLLTIQETNDGFYVEERNGTLLVGPYKRRQDARGVLTRLKNKHIG
jgi:hypothetical protein